MSRPANQDESTPSASRARKRVIWLGLLVSVTCAAGVVSFSAGWIDRESLGQWLDGASGPTGMATYMVVVFVSQMLWFPRMWGLLLGGLLFGPWLGTILSFGADMTSAVVSYVISRYLGAAYVRAQLERRQRLAQLVELLAQRRGLITVFLLRALPVPFTAAGYASGLAAVRWWAYILGTALGIVPGTVLFTAVGNSARDPSSPWFYLGAATVVGAILLGIYLLRRFWQVFQGEVDGR